MPAVALNFAEELQDAIAALPGLDPTLVVGENFTLGNVLDVGDLEGSLAQSVVLTIFEEGSVIIRQGRKPLQERSIRFIFKGSYGQEAVNRCWVLWQAMEANFIHFTTPTFTVLMARTDVGPSVVGADEAGTHLADFVVTFFVKNRTG